MKKLSLIAAAALASITGSVYADAQSVPVTATIIQVCKVSVPTTVATFGSIDPSTTGNKTTNLLFSYKCTKGTTPATFSLGTPSAMTGTGTNTDTMAFTVGSIGTAVAGLGFGAAGTPVSVVATLADTAYQVVKADTYTGSVLVTINP